MLRGKCFRLISTTGTNVPHYDKVEAELQPISGLEQQGCALDCIGQGRTCVRTFRQEKSRTERQGEVY